MQNFKQYQMFTKLVIFGSRQMTAKVSDFRLFLLGKELEPVKAARDLGDRKSVV